MDNHFDNKHQTDREKEFGKELINWYRANARDLPWRRTKDPYKIWLSEVMLQQTQVDTVIDYYHRFIEVLPDIRSLALAEEAQVLKLWEGLGYYSRAKRLKQCAMEIITTYNGQFPEDFKTVLSLPGIGPYTAGAILSIAHNKPYPAVDGNVMRVFSRVYKVSEDIGKVTTRKLFETIWQNIIIEHYSDFNQGLMELGATICTPTNPKCNQCPVQKYCGAFQKGIQSEFPVKLKKVKKKEQVMEVGLVRLEDEMLVVMRPTSGLLADLWGLPIIQWEDNTSAGESLIRELEDTYDIKVRTSHYVGEKVHIFTHIKWIMKVYDIVPLEKVKVEYPLVDWLSIEEIEKLALPTAFRKVIKAFS